MKARTRSLAAVILLSTVGAQACADNAAAFFERGLDYFYGQGVEQNVKRACDNFERAASLGLANAQFNLANCFRTGVGRDKDFEQAIGWYEKASSLGLSDAKNALAAIYLFDLPEQGQSERAISLLREAAAEGHLIAPLTLGMAYYEGLGVLQDAQEALQHYRVASERGHILAQALLYEIYRAGLYGMDADLKEAEYWKQQFMTNRNAYFSAEWTLECALSAAYTRGWGLPKNRQRSTELEESCSRSSNEAVDPTRSPRATHR